MVDISSLDDAEAKRLYAELAYRLAGNASDFSHEEMSAWNTIQAITGDTRLPLCKFVKVYGKVKYREAVDQIERVLDSSLPELTRRNVRDSVRATMLRCLDRHMRRAGVAVTPQSLLSRIGLLNHAVDRAFPGYSAAKLLHRIAA